jgi:excisionase family DNA binding protein
MAPHEAAEALRTDVKTLGRWATAGRIRSFRTPGIVGSGHRRFYRAEIDAIIAGAPLTEAELDALVRGETP